MTQLEQDEKNYAFNEKKDLDVATFEVLIKTINEANSKQTYQGLYDRCFKGKT